MYLAMLETHGNQRYIFSSPRLRESIGASYQLTRLTDWAKGAWAEVARETWRKRHPSYGEDAPWVSRSSGKVILMVDTEEEARGLIGEVTRRALAEAPGMDVSGVYLDMGAATHVDTAALRSVHVKAAEYALHRLPAEARFSRMPFLTQAADSVLPAAPPLGVEDEAKDDRTAAHSLPSRVKRHLAHDSRDGLLSLVQGADNLPKEDYRLATNLEELERLLQPRKAVDESRALSKVAVVHIDGNGVGAIMRDLDQAMKRVPERTFREQIGCEPSDADALRRFILEVNKRLEDAVNTSFVEAWTSVAGWAREAGGPEAERTVVPVVPVIVGGDDVTVITSGDYALPFAAAYLDQYEKATYADDLLAYLGSEDGSSGPMTAAAGVAVVRRNFPFHIAYELAERLVKRAKAVGKPVGQSTIDYHVLFDSTVLDATEILRAYTSFTTRPFRLPQDDDATARPGAGTLPRHEPWRLTCERVAWFTAAMPHGDHDAIPFPKSRAARIRRLLSEAATAEGSPRPEARARAQDRRAKADAEWRAAATELKEYVDIDDKLGGSKALFDLLELSELLPEPYLRSVLGLSGAATAEPTAEPTSSPEEDRA